MIKIITIITCLLLTQSSFAQDDSLKAEILNYSEPNSVLITKGRQLLLSNFLQGDFKKAQSIQIFLTNEVADSEYFPFYPGEIWLLNFWTNNYAEILNSVVNYDKVLRELNQKIRPSDDLLYPNLLRESSYSRAILQDSINQSTLDKIDKDFLSLFLLYLTAEDNVDITQEILNDRADHFLALYPNNDFEGFIKKYIRHKMLKSNWGFVSEFFSGVGMPQGQLGDIYTNHAIFGVAFDMQYKDFVMYLRDYIGFSHTKIDLPFSDGIWEKGSRADFIIPEVSLGYVLKENQRIKLTPFVGIGGTLTGPLQKEINQNEHLKERQLNSKITYLVGINFDLKGKTTRSHSVTFDNDTNSFLRVRYAYGKPIFDHFSSNLHYITIGFGGFFRRIKRSY